MFEDLECLCVGFVIISPIKGKGDVGIGVKSCVDRDVVH